MITAHHLADALATLIKARGKSYREVAAGAGIAHSNLSRLREQRIESLKLRQLLAWWPNESDRRQLMAAHLWDEIVRAGLDPSAFWDNISDEDGKWFSELPPKLQGAFRGLGDTARDDPAFIDLLDVMAQQRLRSAGVAADAISYPTFSDSPAQLAAEDAPARKSRKNTGAPTARPSLPPKPKAS